MYLFTNLRFFCVWTLSLEINAEKILHFIFFNMYYLPLLLSFLYPIIIIAYWVLRYKGVLRLPLCYFTASCNFGFFFLLINNINKKHQNFFFSKIFQKLSGLSLKTPVAFIYKLLIFAVFLTFRVNMNWPNIFIIL